MAALASVVDNFNDGVVDPQWTTAQAGATEAGGVLTITATTGYPRFRSAATYSFVEDQVYVKVALNAGTNAVQALVQAWKDDLNLYGFLVTTTTLQFQVIIANVTNHTSITYDAVNHAWIQLVETGGNVIWQTSPTGAPGTWTTQRTLARALDTSSLVAVALLGGSGTNGLGTVVYDNLNVQEQRTYPPHRMPLGV